MQSFTVPFAKMNGLGNAILVVDMRAFAQDINPQTVIKIASSAQMRFDQMMIIYKTEESTPDFYIKIFNQDGSLAKSCGNGTRCVVEWLFCHLKKDYFVLQTDGGLVKAQALGKGFVSVDMGAPHFEDQAIPLQKEIKKHHNVVWQSLKDPTFVSIGNPHAIFFVEEEVDLCPLEAIAPMIQRDPLFPESCNVSIVQVMARDALKIRTFERGAGLTLACGTAACASAVAAIKRGLTERSVFTHLPGGVLEITWRQDNHVLMKGPTEYEFSGFLNPLTGEWTIRV